MKVSDLKAKYVKIVEEQGNLKALLLGVHCPSSLCFGNEKVGTETCVKNCSKCWGIELLN